MRIPLRRRAEQRVVRQLMDRNAAMLRRSYADAPLDEVRMREGLHMARADMHNLLESL